jgi:transcriptional regulator with XRE-family HTH domain
MARKSGVSFSAISRAENAVGDVNVGTVARLADVLGIPLSDLLAAPSCAVCDGKPPDGYTCNQCGRSAP